VIKKLNYYEFSKINREELRKKRNEANLS